MERSSLQTTSKAFYSSKTKTSLPLLLQQRQISVFVNDELLIPLSTLCFCAIHLTPATPQPSFNWQQTSVCRRYHLGRNFDVPALLHQCSTEKYDILQEVAYHFEK